LGRLGVAHTVRTVRDRESRQPGVADPPPSRHLIPHSGAEGNVR
jgi:hypothetical protein